MNTDVILDAPETEEKKNRPSNFTVSIVLVGLTLAGFLFKTVHWLGAGLLILFPSPLLYSLLLNKFFTKKKRG